MESEQKTYKWTISDSPGRFVIDIDAISFYFYCYFTSLDSAEGVSEMDTFMSISIILITRDEIQLAYTL